MRAIFGPARLKGFPSLTAGNPNNCHFFIFQIQKAFGFNASNKNGIQNNPNHINKGSNYKEEAISKISIGLFLMLPST